MQPVLNGDQAEHFIESFKLLKKFIDESLDLYKEELQSILFPIFTELFLGMVKGRFLKEARIFFSEEKYQFQYSNKEDLNYLEQVDDVNKLAIPDIAKFISNKFQVKVSLYAFQLLFHFVKLNQLILLLEILNTNVNF
jgi:transcription initiation factor TFIID subunit 5